MPIFRQSSASPQNLTESLEHTCGTSDVLAEERCEVLEAVLETLVEDPGADAISACLFLLAHIAEQTGQLSTGRPSTVRPRPLPQG